MLKRLLVCGVSVFLLGSGASAQALAGQNQVPAAVAVNAQQPDFTRIDADYELGHFEEALWALQDMRKAYPQNGDLLYRLGLVQEGLLDFNAALVAYWQATERMADASVAYEHQAGLLYKMNRFEQAIAAFKKVDPASALTTYMLAMAYMNTGKFSDAIDTFKQAAAMDVSFRQKAIYGQGVSYVRMGNSVMGQQLLRQSIAIDPDAEVARLAKKALESAVVSADRSYLSVFALYGIQYDSNVVQRPSSSPSLPRISNASDVAHTFLGAVNYAPTPNAGGLGYKASARFYENAHGKLRTYDVTGVGGTLTPYVALNKKNLLSIDIAYDYYLFNYKRYMDSIRLKPSLTYKANTQLKYILSLTASRENFFQPIALPENNQDGWSLREDIQVYAYSKDHLSSVYLGGNYITARTRGTDWSYDAFGGSAGIDVPLPFVDKLTAGLHGSVERYQYNNIAVGFTQKRQDTLYNADVSLSYQFPRVNVGLMGSYTHEVSTVAVYRYVRMMTGINISGSF